MTRKALVGASVALLLSISPAPSKAALVLGTGAADTCGDWTTNRNDPDSKWLVETDLAWVQGFLSGLNLTSFERFGERAAATNVAGVENWLDNYCRRNPLVKLHIAATALSDELTPGRSHRHR